MKAPASKSHRIDFWDYIVQLPYLGEPVDDVVAAAKEDGWEVDLYDDSPPNPNDPLRVRERIVTLQVRYDYVPMAVRNGRVVSIGAQAPFYR